MITTDLSVPRGQNITFTATASPTMTITGWNFAFSVRQSEGGLLMAQATSGSGITITDATNGVITVQLTAAQTLWPHQRYYWDLWRTDAGFEDQLGAGNFTITPSYRV